MVLQTKGGGVTLAAEVVWVGGPSAADGGIPHGVAFTQVTPAQHQALQALLRGCQVRQGRRSLRDISPEQRDLPLYGWKAD